MGAAITACGALLGCEPAYSVGEPLTPANEVLFEHRAELAVPLADGSLLIDDGSALQIVDAASSEPRPIGLTGEIGALRAYAVLDGTTLIAGTEGTFVVQTGARPGIFRAPIETAIGEDAVIHALAASGRAEGSSDLWVSTDAALYLFRDEVLTEVRVDGVELADAELAPLASRAIWAATSDALLQLRVADDALELGATRIEQVAGARSIAVDDDGTLWIVSGDELASLRRDLHLDRYALPFASARVYASPDANDVWLATDAGFHHQIDRVFRPIEGIELDEVLAGPGGNLLALNDRGVVLVRPRHPITIDGLHDGPILEATRVEILLVALDRVTAIRARAGDVELAVAPGSGTAPPSFVIEPGPVPVGAHQLLVEVEYDDGTLPAQLRTPVEIASDATWANDILPLYDRHCSDCHGERGPAPTRLDSREAWIANADRIIDNVLDGRMPLARPMLPASEIALIQAWASGGFAE